MLNRQIVLERKPVGKLTADCFRMQSSPVNDPGPGEVLCRTLYLSLDPANRAWMQGATYRSELHAGTVMPGFTLAEVVASNDIQFKPGDLVEGDGGWQQYFVESGKRLQKRARREPLSHLLSVLGITGKTAYCELDDAIDHRDGNVYAELKARCPNGIDVYFDNTGGPILEAALARMNLKGRIVCCGVVSQYDTATPASGPRGVPGLLVTKRLKMQGFIVTDYVDLLPQAEQDLARWTNEGKLKVAEDIIDGLDKAPAGLVGLLAGENRGKRMIRVALD